MTATGSRIVPPVKQLEKLFRKHPLRNNQQWADEWGVSKERVRQLRKELGLAPSSQVARQIQAEKQSHRDAERVLEKSRLSDRICPVDSAPVPAARKLTCSPACADIYRSTFTHRVSR